MTEPFRVPERLQLAIRPGRGDEPFRSVMDVVDVPALCRAEVERALEEARRTGFWANVSSLRWRTDYLAQRYGEAAPELECPCGNPDKNGVHYLDHRSPCKPTPSAPAEPQKDGLWLDRETGHIHGIKFITEAEREFVRALALWAKANVPKEYRDVHYAARRLLEAE